MRKRMIVTLLSAAAFSFVLIAGQAQALTRKECDEQWSSLSAAKKAAAKNKTTFVKNCMAKDEAKATEKKEKAETKGMVAGQYSTEAEAKRRCGSDTVVWLNTESGIYHFAGTADFGHTKQGAYMCEKEANRVGRSAKDEKQPPKK